MAKVANMIPTSSISTTRRSERRKSRRLTKHYSQFFIENPYQKQQPQLVKHLPLSLRFQLQKLEYLSIKSLKSISYHNKLIGAQNVDQIRRMRQAAKKQQQRLSTYQLQSDTIALDKKTVNPEFEAEQRQSVNCEQKSDVFMSQLFNQVQFLLVKSNKSINCEFYTENMIENVDYESYLF